MDLTDLTDLTDLLERAADRSRVGLAPLNEMVTRTRRTRRRRRALGVSAAACAAILVLVGIDVVLSGPADQSRRGVAPADVSPSPSAVQPSSPASLNGTWRVTALVGNDGHSVLKGRYADKLRLTLKDGELSGVWGCNDIFGGYRQSGVDGLVFPAYSLGSTLVGCDAPPLLQRLALVRHVSGSGDRRTFHAASWMILVQVRRVDPG